MSSYKTVKECFYSLQTPEAVSATLMQVDNLCHIRVPHTDIDRLSFTQYIDDRFGKFISTDLLMESPLVGRI